MTRKLYYEDSHLYKFDATVLSCEPAGERFAVVLDQTAFFPEGGGQSADTGILADAHVLDVQEKDKKILHYTDKPVPVGQRVTGTLDAAERFRKMQNHSGEHIVSGIAHSLFGCDNVGFHLGDGDVTVDYNTVLSREDLNRIEELSNKAVADNLDIRTEFPDADKLSSLNYRSKLELTQDVRIVTIGDIDCCACCAPHVVKTGEIGCIKLLDFEHYKGGVRIHLLCGSDAMQDYRTKYENIQRISALLCVPQTHTADAVEQMQERLKNKEYELNVLRSRLAESALKSADSFANTLCFFADAQCDMDSLRHAVNAGLNEKEICAGFLPAENGFRYCIGARNTDLRKASKEINTALQGRGGGQPAMIQGTAAADRESILTFFQHWDAK
ncbi:MAG: alanine--tRNA ligase-related protein [Oscillospiraceae bacterium]|nr:alanine--tRNA ligase-related protein [Oscillospiraceae bacterium]